MRITFPASARRLCTVSHVMPITAPCAYFCGGCVRARRRTWNISREERVPELASKLIICRSNPDLSTAERRRYGGGGGGKPLFRSVCARSGFNIKHRKHLKTSRVIEKHSR
jgi:hypothetical protein